MINFFFIIVPSAVTMTQGKIKFNNIMKSKSQHLNAFVIIF